MSKPREDPLLRALHTAATGLSPDNPATDKPPDATLLEKFQDARDAMSAALVERGEEVDLVLTGLLAQRNPLLVGAHGSAKSALVDGLASWIQPAKKFSIVMNRYTMPEELFGIYDIAKMKEGTYERRPQGRLQEADVAILDEVFKASPAILNTTLRALNERVVEDGNGGWKRIPLLCAVASSNEYPDSQDLGAFFDRFLLRKTVKYVNRKKKANLDKLLWGGSHLPKFTTSITREEVLAAGAECKKVGFPQKSRDCLARIVDTLEAEGVRFSDRRLVQSVPVVQCYAWLLGADKVQPEHLECLRWVLWEDPETADKCAKVVRKIANPVAGYVQEKRQEALDVVAKNKPGEAAGKLGEVLDELARQLEDPRIDALVEEVTEMQRQCYHKTAGLKRED